MGNDKNLLAKTNLFPLEMLQSQTGWSKSLLAELCGVSNPLMILVFDRKRSLPAEAVAKLRRFYIPALRKKESEYANDPQNQPFKNDNTLRHLQSTLVKLRANKASAVLNLNEMKNRINEASENAFYLDHQIRYIKEHKLASRSEITALEYQREVARFRSNSAKVKKALQLEVKLEGIKAEISYVESLLAEFKEKKPKKK